MISVGSARMPDAQPGQPVEVVIPLDRTLPNTDYDVSVFSPSWVSSDELKVGKKETSRVTVTVTPSAGMVGAGVLRAICTPRTDPDLKAAQDKVVVLEARIVELEKKPGNGPKDK